MSGEGILKLLSNFAVSVMSDPSDHDYHYYFLAAHCRRVNGHQPDSIIRGYFCQYSGGTSELSLRWYLIYNDRVREVKQP